jgi:ribosomal protein L11 methyltransferase
MRSHPSPIEDAVMKMVTRGNKKRSAAAVIRMVSAEQLLAPREVRAVVRRLVAGGDLAYTYEFGTSFLVRSFQRPVRISDRVVLCPANRTWRPSSGEKVVYMKSGAAFGSGDHPTTRLGVQGIAFALGTEACGPGRVLDIGTGSGILVIAAVRLGMDSGIGTDIDPCALAEARKNVEINGLTERIRIENRHWTAIPASFALVTANLRLPTLMSLWADLPRLCAADASVVMTGIRPEEADGLIRAGDGAGFDCLWQERDEGWAVLVLGRR